MAELMQKIIQEAPPVSLETFALNSLERMISNGDLKVNLPLPSERNLALSMGISRTPVSRALGELERKGVISKISPKKYVLTQISAGSSGILSHAVVFFDRYSREKWESHPDFHKYERGVLAAVDKGAHDLFNIGDINKIRKSAEWLNKERPFGVICSDYFSADRSLSGTFERIRDGGTRIVICGDYEWLAGFDRVVPDHEGGAYEIAKWLHAHGRRKIMRLHFLDSSKYWMKMRNAGYERAAEELGFEKMDEVYIPGVSPTGRYDTKKREGFARIIAGYLGEMLFAKRTEIDAVMCSSDENCGAVAVAFEMLGKKAGKDIWIAGFDNTWKLMNYKPDSKDKPAVTADNCLDMVGEKAVAILTERMNGLLNSGPVLAKIPVKLIEP